VLLKNDQQHYGLITIVLHWLIAIVTFGLFALGLWMVELGYYDTWYKQAPTVHEGLGVLLFIFLLIRIIWRQVNVRPKPPSNHKSWEKTGAHWAHNLLNALLLIISVSGYLIVTAKGDALHVFNLFTLPASLTGFANQPDLAGDVHWLVAWVLILLAGVHALASLKHHFFDKDNSLKRMLGL
jgi:cytochrome b561